MKKEVNDKICYICRDKLPSYEVEFYNYKIENNILELNNKDYRLCFNLDKIDWFKMEFKDKENNDE